MPDPINPMAALLGPILQQAQQAMEKNNEAAIQRHQEVMDLLKRLYDLINIED